MEDRFSISSSRKKLNEFFLDIFAIRLTLAENALTGPGKIVHAGQLPFRPCYRSMKCPAGSIFRGQLRAGHLDPFIIGMSRIVI